jgi:ABC-type sugar transport system ATPase subunit
MSETVAQKTAYRIEGLTKSFPGVLAVDHANLEVRQSEIHGLIGKNGAGKTVLMNLIAGALKSDDGAIWIGEERVDCDRYTPSKAHELGVSLITQEPLIASELSVADNIFMGHHNHTALGILAHRQMEKQVREIIEKLGIVATPGQKIKSLPIEEQQLIAFGRALYVTQARVILLDEITASLSHTRKNVLLKFLKEAVSTSPTLSFTLITHHIDEVLEFCDRVSVMRDGQLIQTLGVAEMDKASLAALIVGDTKPLYSGANANGNGHEADSGTVDAPVLHGEDANTLAETTDTKQLLEVQSLTAEGAFTDVNFELTRGEIVGLAGLEGSGKEEVMLALFGLLKPDSGTIRVNNKRVRLSSPREAYRQGFAYLARKRETQAIIQGLSVKENILVSVYSTLSRLLRGINKKRSNKIARQCVELLNIKTPSLNTKIEHLSGGNKQKVVLSRLTTTTPLVFMLNEPTRGVDLATKPEIVKVVRQRLASQSGVLVTSESEEELINLSDRVLIFYKGRIVRELKKSDPDYAPSTIYNGIQGILQ